MAHNRPTQAGNNLQTSNCSIASLRPNQNRWQIIAEVTQKSHIKPCEKGNRKGKWFSFQLVDESGEIRASAYNADADKYHEMLEVNKIYFVSNGLVKEANKSYGNGNYEIVLNANTTVKSSTEDVDLLSVKFDSAKINESDSKTLGNTVDGAECTGLLNDKDARATQEDKTCGISTYSPSQGISHGKKLEEAFSKVESEKGSSGKKNRIGTMNIIKEEKILILSSYNSLTDKSDWKQLTDIVYKKRNDVLPIVVINHYEYLYKLNELKDRIKRYIERVNSGRANETDPDIKALVKERKSNASPRGQR